MRALFVALALTGCMGPSVFELTPDAAQVADAADAREPRADAATPPEASADADDASNDAERDAAEVAVEDASEVTVDASNDAAEDAAADAQDAAEASSADGGDADVAAEDAPDARGPTPEERCAVLSTCIECMAAHRESDGSGCGWCESTGRCQYDSGACSGRWRQAGSTCE